MRLIAENICIDRGGRRIVQAVSFYLESGQALILRGANGAGKSTLLRAFAGLLPLTAGRFFYRDGPEDMASSLHYVGHADGLKPGLTAGENLDFWKNFLGGDLSPGFPVEEALETLGVGHAKNLPVAYLSAGQKRRVALARLLVAPRALWLLDEPTTALDVAAQAVLADMIGNHRAGGGMAIAATHAPLGLSDARGLRLGALPAPSAASMDEEAH